MFTGPLPTTSVYGTWSENVEIRSADDGELCDLSDITEITLKVLNPVSKSVELSLTMSDGDIVIPSTGVIQWRAEVDTMGTLEPKAYEVVLILEDDTDTLPLILGTISVVE